MFLYQKLKAINWINYYLLGPQNNNWKETLRNPFYGIKQFLGVPNINAHSIIDLRMFYIPIEYITVVPSGAKKTIGEPWIRWMMGKWIIFELRKTHPVENLYYNGGLTFSFNLVNKYFPWTALNIRPCYKYYFNFGLGFEGTNELDKEVAEIGLKFRIANYTKEIQWNPNVVSPEWYEGGI